MATSKEEIRSWLNAAKKNHATHLLVVCDTFEYEDYPVEVSVSEDVRKEYAKYNGQNMQTVMECYDLELSLEEQLNESRAMHF